MSNDKKINEIFSNDVIVVLAEEPKLNQNILKFQDYILNGKSYIPIFTSMDKFKESTKEKSLGKPICQINGILFASILNGNEEIRINIGLSDEFSIKGDEVKRIMKTKIENTKF